MSIQIRNRWDNSVIYTAKNAADVREALQEAIRKGANLHSADKVIGEKDLVELGLVAA